MMPYCCSRSAFVRSVLIVLTFASAAWAQLPPLPEIPPPQPENSVPMGSAADFAEICRRINVRDLGLEHINRTDHKPWQQSYTRRMFEVVRDIHAPDIAYFGYADDPAAYGIS